MKKILKGFTLLELLIVIGIIGVLVALATVSYSSAQKSGRDSKRKQDMVAIQNALEQYYSDAVNSYKYPMSGCQTVAAAPYMKTSWPMDPDGTNYASDCTTGTTYCVCAVMEKNTTGNSGAGCNFAAGKTHYCVSALQ